MNHTSSDTFLYGGISNTVLIFFFLPPFYFMSVTYSDCHSLYFLVNFSPASSITFRTCVNPNVAMFLKLPTTYNYNYILPLGLTGTPLESFWAICDGKLMIKAVFLNDAIISTLSWWHRPCLSPYLHLARILADRELYLPADNNRPRKDLLSLLVQYVHHNLYQRSKPSISSVPSSNL